MSSELNETELLGTNSSLNPTAEPSALATLSKTAGAAKMSGTFHETAGFIKRTLGKLSSNSTLEDAGRNEQLLGKVHHLVGSFWSTRDAALSKAARTRAETQALCRKHGGKFIDCTSEFIDELKSVFLK